MRAVLLFKQREGRIISFERKLGIRSGCQLAQHFLLWKRGMDSCALLTLNGKKVVFKNQERQMNSLQVRGGKYLRTLFLYTSSCPESHSYRARKKANKPNKHKIGEGKRTTSRQSRWKNNREGSS